MESDWLKSERNGCLTRKLVRVAGLCVDWRGIGDGQKQPDAAEPDLPLDQKICGRTNLGIRMTAQPCSANEWLLVKKCRSPTPMCPSGKCLSESGEIPYGSVTAVLALQAVGIAIKTRQVPDR